MVATPFDCVVYFNWWDYLKAVADGVGISLPPSLYDKISSARSYYEGGNYPMARELARQAVDGARGILKAHQGQIRARCDALVGSIQDTISAAMSEGIEIRAFGNPFNVAMSMYTSDDFIAAFDTLSGLLEDLSNYVARAREGIFVEPETGTYDIPEGTNHIIAIEYAQIEALGWMDLSPAALTDRINEAVIQAGGEGVIEVRRVPPRLIVFARGSPIAFITALLLIIAVVAVLVVIGIFWWQPAYEAEKRAEVIQTKIEFTATYKQAKMERVAAGELSQETADKLNEDFDEQMDKYNYPEPGLGFFEMLLLLIALGISGFLLIKLLPVLLKRGKK